MIRNKEINISVERNYYSKLQECNFESASMGFVREGDYFAAVFRPDKYLAPPALGDGVAARCGV